MINRLKVLNKRGTMTKHELTVNQLYHTCSFSKNTPKGRCLLIRGHLSTDTRTPAVSAGVLVMISDFHLLRFPPGSHPEQ